MSTYTKEHVTDIVPLIRRKARTTHLRIEDQEDLAQDTVVEVLECTADDRKTMLRTMNEAFKRNFGRILHGNVGCISYTQHFNVNT